MDSAQADFLRQGALSRGQPALASAIGDTTALTNMIVMSVIDGHNQRTFATRAATSPELYSGMPVTATGQPLGKCLAASRRPTRESSPV